MTAKDEKQAREVVAWLSGQPMQVLIRRRADTDTEVIP